MLPVQILLNHLADRQALRGVAWDPKGATTFQNTKKNKSDLVVNM
jgi:hypothetical protein